MASDAEVQELRERVGLLEYQLSLFASLTAQIVGGRWTGEDTSGELPFAAAELVALLGGQQAADAIGFQPVSFGRG
ncbi:MAG: hypothetical protein JO057_29390 [Chloroflexi bacterium]|nr:hypothetical protein [Chloroflexota bacterium]